jgi:hypothetical protein
MQAVIPAQPNFDLVTLLSNAFSYTPITAWLVDDSAGYLTAMPITADWRDNNPDQNKIIRFPDGSINFIAGPIFPRGQEAEALAHAVKLREKQFEKATHSFLAAVMDLPRPAGAPRSAS